MENNSILKLRTSLVDAIEKWIEEAAQEEDWIELNTYVGHHTAELMGSSAFNVLLAQKDLSEYLLSKKLTKSKPTQQ